MRLSQLLIGCTLLCLVSITAHAIEIDPNRYEIYYGDVDTNGFQDIYFHGKDQIILIHGDIVTPIVIAAPDSFVLYQYPTGYGDPVALTLTDLSGLTEASLATDFFMGDFDGDGIEDIFVRGATSGDYALTLQSTSGDNLPAKITEIHPNDLPHNLSDRAVAIVIVDENADGRDDITVDSGDPSITNIAYHSDASGAPINSQPSSPSLIGAVNVGSTNVGMSVGSNGSASAGFPISVPAGVNDMHPNIGLVYNSNGGNGEIGDGWGLSGLSSIERCPTNQDFGGNIDPVDFDGNDKFCLDGSPLVAITGNYGAEDTEYRTRMESFIKIISHGSEGNCYRNGVNVNGPEWFEVIMPTGQKLEYGNTEDSRLRAPGCDDIISWANNKNTDTFGNAVNFTYTENGGEHLVDNVNYNSGATKIEFTYTSRSDSETNYYVGSAFQQTKLLQNIDVLESNLSLRRYTLTYENDSITQRSRLKTVQECAQSECLPATTFDWTSDLTPAGGFASSNWVVSNQWSEDDSRTFTGDFNGDGLEDIASVDDDGNAVFIKLSTGNGEFTSQTWNIPDQWGGTKLFGVYVVMAIQVGDFNGDGLTDIASPDGNQIHVKLSNGAGFDSQSWPVTNAWGDLYKYTWTGDFNGDSRTDIASANGSNIFVKLSNGNGFNSVAWTVNNNWNGDKNNYIDDFNGDGLTDIAIVNGANVYMKLSFGTGFTQQTWTNNGTWGDAKWTFVGDYNGDGYPDFASRIGAALHMKLNTGNGFVNQTWTGTSNNWGSAEYTRVGDFNGDGVDDLGSANAGTMHLYISDNTDFVNQSWPIDNAWGSAATAFFSDFNGDTITDIVAADGSLLRRKMSLTKPTVMYKTTNGFGVENKVTYKHLTDSTVYSKGAIGIYPEIAVTHSGLVVSKLENSNGQGGFNSASYTYSDLRAHAMGKGILGFYDMTVTDDQSNISSRTIYSHDYVNRTQGMPIVSETKAANGTTLGLSSTYYQLPITEWDAGTDSYRYQIRASNSSVTRRDLNGAFLSKQQVTISNYDAYGNARDVETKVLNENNLLAQTITVETVVSHNTNNWFLNRITRSEVTTETVGEAARKKLTTWQFDETTNRLIGERGHNPDNGAILIETRYGEDENGNLAVDGFGNNLATTVKGADFASRTSHGYIDATGRRATSATNTIGHSASTEFYPATSFASGAYPYKPKIATDANGIKVKFTYDVFGRVVTTSAAYNTVSQVDSQTVYRLCDTSCPANAVYYIVSQAEGGGESRVYIDQLGRTLRQGGQTKRIVGNDSEYVYVDYQWDNRGRNTGISEPFFDGTSPTRWTNVNYDDLDRPLTTTASDGRVDEVIYNGLTTTSYIDKFDEFQQKNVVRNSLGQLQTATDDSGEVLTYEYDSHSNLVKVIDPAANETVVNYDAIGRKTSMVDPDKGAWSYTYNSLGQLITQTNGRNETTCYAYDLLGRKVSQIDYYQGSVSTAIGQTSQATAQCSGDAANPETATWVYDTANGAGKGKLHSVQGADGFQQIMTYNSIGLPYEVDETLNGSTYTSTTIYDQLNRPVLAFYPGENQRFATKTLYNDLSMPVEIRNGDDNALYYQLQELNARGQVVFDQYGNGVTNGYGYNADTALPSFVGAYRSGSGSYDLQSQTFDFDRLGNLTYRDDAINNYEESFYYDNLNRLERVEADMGNSDVRVTDITYDRLGNIRSKTGVGNYSYSSECTTAYGPHAVCEIDGTKNTSYAYDLNGNMTAGDGRTLQYTTFDKPDFIQKGNNTTEITYGPSRSRYFRRDTDNTAVTEYTYAGAYEKVEFKADGVNINRVEERHHVAGLAIVTFIDRDTVNETDTTRFLHKDHLGSINLITDEVGNVFERFSYDPWGKKRAPTLAQLEAILAKPFSAMTVNEKGNYTINAALLKSSVTNRGFTGHEQMDGIGLIHMNGRVYDPEIGRMLQADPFVPNFTDLQSFNRYSYVNNNPLSYTDPDGYFLKRIKKSLKRFRNKVKRSAKRLRGNIKQWGRNFLNQVGEVFGDKITSFLIHAGSLILCGGNPACAATVSSALHYEYARSQGVSSREARKVAAIAGAQLYFGTKYPFEISGVPINLGVSPSIGGFGGGSGESNYSSGNICSQRYVFCQSSGLGGDEEKGTSTVKTQSGAIAEIRSLWDQGILDLGKIFSGPNAIDEAAKEVLNLIHPISEEYGFEIGGNIDVAYDPEQGFIDKLWNGKRILGYRYTWPQVGGPDGMRLGRGEYTAAQFHTHPGGDFYASYFSSERGLRSGTGDVEAVRNSKFPLYMSHTFGGSLEVRVCRPMSDRCSPNFRRVATSVYGVAGDLVE